jgi:SSS family solute:Na+ symporter
LRLRRPHRYALLAGLVAGVLTGTWLVAAQGFVSVTRIRLGGVDVAVYAGLVALAVNLAVVAVATPVLDRAGIGRGLDSTGTTVNATIRTEWEAEA